MKFFTRYGSAIFWMLALADIALIIAELETYRVFTKPLLVPILMVTIFARTGFDKHKTSKIILAAALALATAGDILLLGSANQNLFLAGLVSFLLMQLLYSVYFLRIKPFRWRHLVSISASFLLIAFVAATLTYLLWNALGDYRVPLIIYSFFLALMFTTAVNVYHYRISKSLALKAFIPGAALFVLSDLILAANMFYFKEAFVGIAIMATYCGAQFYLARGFVKHLR
ncbi:lysoplasmalogenase [Aridibaculum aurantiacum]|uniref:lysoplasmalogenase n=1 Tax=Aridibaculum aurantiacum TaxID=2810307 RepID=UPI001A9732F2|nr:lysoplasmalogenase [Aridibaculum aurantiacum]